MEVSEHAVGCFGIRTDIIIYLQRTRDGTCLHQVLNLRNEFVLFCVVLYAVDKGLYQLQGIDEQFLWHINQLTERFGLGGLLQLLHSIYVPVRNILQSVVIHSATYAFCRSICPISTSNTTRQHFSLVLRNYITGGKLDTLIFTNTSSMDKVK